MNIVFFYQYLTMNIVMDRWEPLHKKASENGNGKAVLQLE